MESASCAIGRTSLPFIRRSGDAFTRGTVASSADTSARVKVPTITSMNEAPDKMDVS